jgi:hypothetical protein
MGCRTLLATPTPATPIATAATVAGLPVAPRGGYTARWLQWGDHPRRLVPLLAAILHTTFDGGLTTFAAALLAHDWSELDLHPRAARARRRIVVPGVGYAAADTPPQPVRHGHLDGEVTADLEWLYLIDTAPRRAAVIAYEATVHSRWLLHSRHPLRGHPAAVSRPGAPSCR